MGLSCWKLGKLWNRIVRCEWGQHLLTGRYKCFQDHIFSKNKKHHLRKSCSSLLTRFSRHQSKWDKCQKIQYSTSLSVLEFSDGAVAIRPRPTYFGLSGDLRQQHFSALHLPAFRFLEWTREALFPHCGCIKNSYAPNTSYLPCTDRGRMPKPEAHN